MQAMHRGFRVCFDCLRGYTPAKRKAAKDELDARVKAAQKQLDETPSFIDTLTEEQALQFNMMEQEEEE